MGLLERLTARLHDSGGPYECADCGRRLETQRQACPDCGCYTIDRHEW